MKGLFPKQEEVLVLVGLGCTSKRVAQILHKSRRTVDDQRRRGMRRLGLLHSPLSGMDSHNIAKKLFA